MRIHPPAVSYSLIDRNHRMIAINCERHGHRMYAAPHYLVLLDHTPKNIQLSTLLDVGPRCCTILRGLQYSLPSDASNVPRSLHLPRALVSWVWMAGRSALGAWVSLKPLELILMPFLWLCPGTNVAYIAVGIPPHHPLLLHQENLTFNHDQWWTFAPGWRAVLSRLSEKATSHFGVPDSSSRVPCRICHFNVPIARVIAHRQSRRHMQSLAKTMMEYVCGRKGLGLLGGIV